MSRLLIVIAVLLAAGCSDKKPPADEPKVTQDLIAEIDGVRLWRVKDLKINRTVYVATPSGEVSTELTKTDGKTTSTEHHQTVAVPRGESKP